MYLIHFCFATIHSRYQDIPKSINVLYNHSLLLKNNTIEKAGFFL